MEQVHASCVAIDGTGVLLCGPSGSGKSDLALRLLDGGAQLVADDRTDLTGRDGGVWATSPAEIAGLIEVRGVGVLRLDAIDGIGLGLVVNLVVAAAVDRHPEPDSRPRRRRSGRRRLARSRDRQGPDGPCRQFPQRRRTHNLSQHARHPDGWAFLRQ